MYIALRNDNQKHGANTPWDRSNDRNSCTKIFIEDGYVSGNSAYIKEALIPQYGRMKRYRTAITSNSLKSNIVLVHAIEKKKARSKYYRK